MRIWIISDKINDVYNSYLETPKKDGGKRKDISFRWYDFKNFTDDDYKRKNNWDLLGF